MAVVSVLESPSSEDRALAARDLAVFDLDRTLLPGSSLMVFGKALADAGVVRRRDVARRAVQSGVFAARGLGASTLERLCRDVVAAATGCEQSQVRDVAFTTAPRVVDRLFPAARWLLAHHRDRGDRLVLLSAGPQELVEAVGLLVGFDIALGTEAEVVDGRYTGRLAGPFCHGTGKVERLRSLLEPTELASASAYGDSSSDLPVLRAVGRPVAVNPDRGLRSAAAAAAWPILRFA